MIVIKESGESENRFKWYLLTYLKSSEEAEE